MRKTFKRLTGFGHSGNVRLEKEGVQEDSRFPFWGWGGGAQRRGRVRRLGERAGTQLWAR